jgi:multiple sugar transport system ATP-binding protein
MTLGSKIAVMQGGEIRQIGSPREIYDRPADLFVAGFIGSPSMNFIRTGVVSHQDGVGTRLQDAQSMLRPWIGKDVILGILPEQITDSASAQRSGPDVYGRSFKVELVEPTGPDTLVLIRINGEVVCGRSRPARPGNRWSCCSTCQKWCSSILRQRNE